MSPATAEPSRELSVVGEPTDLSKVTGSHFHIELIVYSVCLVIDAAISMRASSRVLGVMAEISGRPPFEEPCHTTVQNFIVRIGLYLLQHRTLMHDDWIWIIDHTIAAGTMKCLVVLGIRQSDFARIDRPLQHRDLEPLALIPVEHSNGVVVHQQLAELSGRHGVPLAVVSDRGSDLKKGVELLQKDCPGVIALYDIVHLVSRLIEKVLKQNERWDEYRKASCKCANAVRQSSFAHLKPPCPKTKARYMNIDREVRWGERALRVLDRVRSGGLTERQKTRLPLDKIEAKFGWLDDYRSEIGLWTELSNVGQTANKVIRRHGYAAESVARLREALGESQHVESRAMAGQIIEQVESMCQAVGDHPKLPGSSEVLESLIGRGKQLLGPTSGNSMTKQILAMATATAELTPTLIRTALASCRIKHIKQWCLDHLPRGVQSLRQEDLPSQKEEENLRKANPAPIPNF